MYEMSRVNVEVENRSTFTLRPTLYTLGRLSKGVFQRTTSTGSEAFSVIICLDANKFVLVRVFILVETILSKIWAKPRPKNEKGANSGKNYATVEIHIKRRTFALNT